MKFNWKDRDRIKITKISIKFDDISKCMVAMIIARFVSVADKQTIIATKWTKTAIEKLLRQALCEDGYSCFADAMYTNEQLEIAEEIVNKLWRE